MGFDVTFHPVSVADLQRFVFDLVEDGARAPASARGLTSVRAKQADVREGVLTRLPGLYDEAKRQGGFGQTVAFAAAAVAGYRHPYWYARGVALSFLAADHPKVDRLFTSLTKVARGPVAKLKDDSGALITANYSASGLIVPGKLPALRKVLEGLASPAGRGPLFKVFDDEGYDALRRALDYAEAHELGLMEASDLVVPMANEGFTDLDNLRAHFLKNEAYAKAGPPPAKKPARGKARKRRAARN